MAATYTTLTLAYLEENLYEIMGEIYNNNIKTEFIRSWKRYSGNVHEATIYIIYSKIHIFK